MPCRPSEEHRPSSAACARIHGHLARGAPWDACDEFRTALATQAPDAELLYCGALAHARAGAPGEAHALLDRAGLPAAVDALPDRTGTPRDADAALAQALPASMAAPLLAELLSLRGRLWKDALHRARSPSASAALAQRAREQYLAAWRLQHDPFPGINAASLSLLAGDRAAALDLANAVAARVAAVRLPRSAWDHATLGEAALLLGEPERAGECYAAAHALAGDDLGAVAAMRRQLLLLERVLPDASAVLAHVPAADVVAFTGHMVDAPGRISPRLPAALLPRVEAAVRACIGRLHRPVFYGSAACGADLVVIECALAMGAEVNVVLPFDREDFVRTSVAVGGPAWLPRFEAALSRVAHVIAATDERYLGDDVLFGHAAELVEGLAVLRADQLQSSPRLLSVMDAGDEGGVGGTRSAFERWTRAGGRVDCIDIAALRADALVHAGMAMPQLPAGRQAPAPSGAAAATSPPAAAAPAAAPAAAAATPSATPAAPSADDRPRPARALKTLLFADFAGYSKLRDIDAARFQTRFWAIAASSIAATPTAPLFANTWGDGLFVVFDSPRDGAAFALQLSADVEAVDWTDFGLAASRRLRVCMHAGPVFRAFDPVIARDNYFGSSVTRAARIEPITPPGSVFASEPFAGALVAAGHDPSLLEYVGILDLAKGFGISRIYRLAGRP